MSADDDDEIPDLVPAQDSNPKQSSISTDSSSAASAAAKKSSQVERKREEEPPVPLCILTGWLGAGKTTLLTYLLETLGRQGKQIAVVQNEGTAMGVEDALRLQDDSGLFGEILELANGCVCCSVKSDFVLALETLLRKKRFDYVFLECSGLADAGPLARLFWVDEELESNMYLDGIVSLVDARLLEGHLKGEQPHSKQVVRQIAFADRIILNKMDLVNEEDVARLSSRIRMMNPTAKICPTLRSQVCLDDILAIRAFESSSQPVIFQHAQQQVSDTAVREDPFHEHFHDHSIASLVFEHDKDSFIDLTKLKQWLAKLLWVYDDEENPSSTALASSTSTSTSTSTSKSISSSLPAGKSALSTPASASLDAKAAKKKRKKQRYRAKRKLAASNKGVVESKGMEIFRMKAVLSVKGDNKQYFLQAVQQMFEVNLGNSEWGVGPRISKLIVIGRHLDENALREGFASCAV